MYTSGASHSGPSPPCVNEVSVCRICNHDYSVFNITESLSTAVHHHPARDSYSTPHPRESLVTYLPIRQWSVQRDNGLNVHFTPVSTRGALHLKIPLALSRLTAVHSARSAQQRKHTAQRRSDALLTRLF